MDMRMVCFNDMWYPHPAPHLPHSFMAHPGHGLQYPVAPAPQMFLYPHQVPLHNKGPTIAEMPRSRVSGNTGGESTFYYSSSSANEGRRSCSSSTRALNIYEPGSESGGSGGGVSRPWRLVNQDVSQRMLAAASDSPPQIPKRDNRPTNTRNRGRATNTLDSSAEESTEGDRRPMSEVSTNNPGVGGQLVPFNAQTDQNNDQSPSPYYYYGNTMPSQPAGPPQGPGGPMWPPQMGPPQMGHPQMGPPLTEDGSHPPMPPCPPFMGGFPPGMGPPPGFGEDGSMGPMGPPPPFMMPPPPHAFGKPPGSQNGEEDMSMAMVPYGAGGPPMMNGGEMPMMPYFPHPPPSFPMGGHIPPPMMHMHPMMMPPPPPQMFMPPPPMTKGGYDVTDMDINRMIKRKQEIESQRYRKKQESTCYIVCCKGHTQVLWIIIAIVLIGVVLGLVLGLTLV